MDLYLIDGNSYVYRAFFAIRGLTNSKGLPTNAVFGFTNMLMKILREKKPEGIAVIFDSPVPTERHRIYEAYKAQRPETPSDLVLQLPHIRRMIGAFCIPAIEMPGYEADDIIGTIAKAAAEDGHNVYIVTADKDMLQLVGDHIKVYDPMKDRLLDADYVIEKFGVGPGRVTEFMALTGDASDNIPGIKGIGEKTARELLTTFASLDDLLEHPDRIKKEKLRNLVAEHSELALLSKKLATIDTAVPVEMDMAGFLVSEPDWLSLMSLFREFEFSSLMKLIPSTETISHESETIISEEVLRKTIASIKEDVAVDTEATGRDPHVDMLVGISLCSEKGKAVYVPVGHLPDVPGAEDQLPLSLVAEAVGPVMSDDGIVKIGHNLKYDIALLQRSGLAISGRTFDTMIAAYLLNPNKPNHSLDEVSFEYLGKRKQSFAEALKKRSTFAEVPIEEAAPYAAADAALAFELKEVLAPKLSAAGLEGVFFDIEMPLIGVLVGMEKRGVRIDTGLLGSLSRELASEIEGLQRRIYFLAGEEFNINSPKQLAKVLFEGIGLRPSKKTKTGFSTDVDVLLELAETHDLPREVLNYRTLSKLKSTYIDALPALVDPATGRIHTSFNQTIAATGRLSSSEPNLQNIPVRGDLGRRIRGAFIADEGNALISADYSQIELRVLAHLSGDSGLVDAFNNDIDIHARTASELFGVTVERITQDMRRIAKTVNFGVIYGMSDFGLSEALNIDRNEARQFISRYFERHPGVRRYADEIVAEAREKGFVTTLMGRRRPITELKSNNRNIRLQAERLALNSPIQGTAADIVKIAMIRIWKRFADDRIPADMLLQVHDELLFETPASEAERVTEIVREEMEGAVALSVPLKVEIGSGRSWAEAH